MPLLGLDTVQQLRLQIDGLSLACLQKTASPKFLPPELSEFYFLFGNKLRLAKNVLHEVKQRANERVSAKVRRLPLMLRDQISAELERLERKGIIERVNASEWMSPIVVVKKKDVSVKIYESRSRQSSSTDFLCLTSCMRLVGHAAWFSKLDLASA